MCYADNFENESNYGFGYHVDKGAIQESREERDFQIRSQYNMRTEHDFDDKRNDDIDENDWTTWGIFY